MIKDKEKTIQTIKDWICNYAEKNGKSKLILTRDNTFIGYDLGQMLLINICLSQTKYESIIIDNEHNFEYLSLDRIDKLSGNNGIIISPLNKSDCYLTRNYHKYSTLNTDIFPLIDLYESEICVLLDLDPIEEITDGLKNLEWAQEENKKYGIIENDELPQHTSNWFKYTLPQKELISKLHQREKQTRHKAIVGRPMLKFS